VVQEVSEIPDRLSELFASKEESGEPASEQPVQEQKLSPSWPSSRLIRTSLKGRDALPHITYFAVIAAIGLPLCVGLLRSRPFPETKTAVLLTVLGLISYHLPVTMPSSVQFNPGFPLLLSALYYQGISASLLVAIPSSLLFVFTRKHGLLNCLFNAGQITLSLCAAELVGLRVGWQPGVPADNKAVLAVCLMVLTVDVINIFLVSVSVAIMKRRPVWESFKRTFLFERRAIIAQRAFVTVVSMLLTSHMGNITFLVMFIGVLSLRLQNLFQKELAVKTEEAETDPLTNVYNMRYLRRWLKQEINSANGRKARYSFIFADVDGLKAVNDTYGHEKGNDLLIHIANLLVSNVRSQDRVARYGGDEFVIVCPHTSLSQAVTLARRILKTIAKQPFTSNGIEIPFGLSMGVASWPDHGDTVFDVIRMADRAMYFAKRRGGGRIHSAADL
jgi:diguanylate cyclase (GGDEF)-like protein